MPPVFSRCCRTQQHREKVGTREKIFGRGGLKNRGRRIAPTGFSREGKTPVFLRGRDATAEKVFPEASRDHEQGRAERSPCAIGFTASPEIALFDRDCAL